MLKSSAFPDYPQLKAITYMDYAGSGLCPQSAVDGFKKRVGQQLYANPHSKNEKTDEMITRVRQRVLKWFDADPGDYEVVFTSGATAGLKLISESFDGNRSIFDIFTLIYTLLICFVYQIHYSLASSVLILFDNHTSVLGTRSVFEARGMRVSVVPETILESILNRDNIPWLPRKPFLLCYAPQSNFDGRLYPLEWISKFKALFKQQSFVLLDASSFASTKHLSLTKYPADFVAVSFYKIFGYPTGLGALLLRKSSTNMLKKTYFGGGTVDVMSPLRSWHIGKSDLSSHWEDGTPDFLGILALDESMNAFERNFTSIHCVNKISMCLTEYCLAQLSELKHGNGAPIIHVYRKENHKYGPIVNFNLYTDSNNFIGCDDFSLIASNSGIILRSGSFCNPGAHCTNLGLSDNDLYVRYYLKGKSCSNDGSLMEDGRPSGSIRISFGCLSTKGDVDKLVHLINSYFTSHKVDRLFVDPGEYRGKILKLSIYPIKSCHEYSITTKWYVNKRGLKYDRLWRLETSDGSVMTQKKHPNMVYIKPEFINNGLFLFKYKDYKSITISINAEISQEINEWFSNILETKCSLVKSTDFDKSFSNKSPILLINQQSFDALSIEMKISSFRANIILSTCTPFIEDHITYISINDVLFKPSEKCKRCTMISIDQDTGIINHKTFGNVYRQSKSFRNDEGLYFGRYLSIKMDDDEEWKIETGAQVKCFI